MKRTPLAQRGRAHTRPCQEGVLWVLGHSEVPRGVGLVLGFPLDILVHVLQTIPGLAECVGVGCGAGSPGETRAGRERI